MSLTRHRDHCQQTCQVVSKHGLCQVMLCSLAARVSTYVNGLFKQTGGVVCTCVTHSPSTALLLLKSTSVQFSKVAPLATVTATNAEAAVSTAALSGDLLKCIVDTRTENGVERFSCCVRVGAPARRGAPRRVSAGTHLYSSRCKEKRRGGGTGGQGPHTVDRCFSNVTLCAYVWPAEGGWIEGERSRPVQGQGSW